MSQIKERAMLTSAASKARRTKARFQVLLTTTVATVALSGAAIAQGSVGQAIITGIAIDTHDDNMAFTDVAYAAGIGQVTIPYMGWGIGCVDFDNDGWPDLFVVNGHVYPQVDALATGMKYRQRKLVFLNQKDGKFIDVSDSVGGAVKIPQASRGAAFGDLDNDGRIDVVVENIDGLPMLLHNEGRNANHWITLELIGTRSNRLALGAKVHVVAGAVSQVDEVRSGGSYLSQNDLRQHFGLGSANKVDDVEIRWPSGNTQVLHNLAADRFYIVKEGTGVVSPEQARPASQGKR